MQVESVKFEDGDIYIKLLNGCLLIKSNNDKLFLTFVDITGEETEKKTMKETELFLKSKGIDCDVDENI